MDTFTVTESANAKINLGLCITGRRTDGYHTLHTVFMEILFGDKITLVDDPTGKISLELVADPLENQSAGLLETVPVDATNLCMMAAQIFGKHTGIGNGVRIVLNKRIPPGAGLGGGSSDAAAVLRGLNQLWGARLSDDELDQMAIELGADVSFFIHGGIQLGEGIGDVLTPLHYPFPYSVVVVLPDVGIDTAWAYAQLKDRTTFSSPPGFDKLLGQRPIPWGRFINDFDGVVYSSYPELLEIRDELKRGGAVFAGLTGSGGAVFGFFENEKEADQVLAAMDHHQGIKTRCASSNY